MALIEVQPALEQDHRDPFEVTEQEPARVARRAGGRPAGQVGERDGDGVDELVGQRPEAGAQDDPDSGAQVGPLADGRLEGVEPGAVGGRGKLVGTHLDPSLMGDVGVDDPRKHVARQGTNTGMSVAPAGQRSARKDLSKEAKTLM
jgi:hypothetical protein